MFLRQNVFSGFSVADLDSTKKFYSEVLGMKIQEGSMGLLELQIEGSNSILIYPKSDHVPATFTILNFPVTDIEAAVKELNDKGVSFEQYGGEIQTDEKGISRDPRGPNIAWFKDPSGNILSLIEMKEH